MLDTSEPPALAVSEPAWTGRVVPLEKGTAVAASERRPAEKATGDGLSVRIPLRDIIQVLTALLAIAAVVWTLRSDIRDIKTSMDFQNKIQEERAAALVKSLEGVQRRQELQSFEIQEMKLSLARAGIGTVKLEDGKP